MRLRYIPDSELEKLPVIKSKVVLTRNKFHPEGLFSEQIFGPINDYQCWCGNNGELNRGQRCPRCGIKITSSIERRNTFATIKVDRLINPIAIEIITFSNKKMTTIINKILSLQIAYYSDGKRKGFIPLEKTDYSLDKHYVARLFKCTPDEIDEKYVIYGLDAIFELACQMCDANKLNGNKSLSLNKLNEMIINDEFFTKYILVIPPDLRPAMKVNKQIQLDMLNKLYLSILLMLDTEIVVNGPMKHLFECKIQQAANQINKFVFENVGKKSGLIRNKMSGKRIDFSGRSVITVDPEIPFSHIKVSRLILLQLWKLEIARILMERGDYVTFKMAFDELQRMYEEYSIPDDIKEIIDKVASDQFVIFNRQPTLHKGGMFAAKVIPSDSYTIGISPLVCFPLNADFDGDSYYGDIELTYTNKKTQVINTIKCGITDLVNVELDL